MKCIKHAIIVFVYLFSLASFALGYTGGDGTFDSPYEIATAADLIQLGDTPDDYTKHFKLTANIDLFEQGPGIDGTFLLAVIAPDTNTYSSASFEGPEFAGYFNGNGFTISNLTINTQSQDYSYLGLFGSIGVGAVIENLGLENVTIITGWDTEYIGGLCGRSDGLIDGCFVQEANVIGKYYVGGLCGHNESGTIAHSFATGLVAGQSDTGGLCGSNGKYASSAGTIQYCYAAVTVNRKWSGSSYKLGGLCGGNWGTILQSYATGDVAGQYYVGGLCGANTGTISDSYATGGVDGDLGIGGFCGVDDRGKIIRCYSVGHVLATISADGGFCGQAYIDGTYPGHGVTYEDTANFWDIQTSGITFSAMGEGRNTSWMKTLSMYTDAGWDFDDSDGGPAVWRMALDGSTYPALDWQPVLNRYSGGDGSEQTPWQIATKDDLLLLSDTPADWDKAFIVTADIDLAGTIFNKAPIAPDTDNDNGDFQGTPFTGTFDGNGYILRNLTIYNDTGGDYIGLFGRTEGAVLTSVIVDNLLIDALGDYSEQIGGLIGWQEMGITQDCAASGIIHAVAIDPFFGGDVGFNVGGLIGSCNGYYSESLAVVRCSSSVEIHGTIYVGGLVGYQVNCTLRECYSNGSVEGHQYTGGLVGIGFGIIERCFTTAAVSNRYAGRYLGGLAGYQGGIISDSWARCAVLANSGSSRVGGFAGSCFGVSRCYSASTITLRDYVMDYIGAFAGQPQGIVGYSFFDDDVAGWPTDSSGAAGLTTSQMQTADEFINAGWDFDSEDVDGTPAVWMMVGVNYPTLVWYQLIQPLYSGGKGTLDDPYQIATVDDLLYLSATSTDWDKHFILTANIDLTGNTFDRAVIAPDTDESADDFQGVSFTGSFNGNGLSISNLTIDNSSGGDFLGLFGRIDTAEIWDLQVQNTFIVATGDSSHYLGALAGYINSSLVRGCSSSGNVVGGDWSPSGFSGNNSYAVGSLVGYAIGEYHQFISLEDCSCSADAYGHWAVGGLVGYQLNCGIIRSASSGSVLGWNNVGGLTGVSAGVIDQCFNSATVSGTTDCYQVGGLTGVLVGGKMSDSYSSGTVLACFGGSEIGGLVGDNGSSIERCYSTGYIETCGASTSFVGGLIGINSSSGIITDSFWDIWASGLSSSAGGTGMTTPDMMQLWPYASAGWDFDPASVDGTPAVWMIQDGADYPRLVAFRYGAGGGTAGNPYTIDSVEKLMFLSNSPEDWGKSFILMADLNLSGYIFDKAVIAPDNVPSSQVTSFDGTRFTGSFNGNGHAISNLSIRTEDGGDYLGLFGCIQNAVIKNLRMENVSITALGKSSSIGTVAGQTMNSQLSLCVVSGSIAAEEYSPETTLSEVGGLVGKQFSGLIESCASRVNISSGDKGFLLGGIVGWLTEGTIRHAFSAGTIEGGEKTQHVGALAGQVDMIAGNPNPETSIIENSCAHGSIVVGQNSSSLGGLVGSLYTPCELRNSYSAVRLSYTGIFGVTFGGLAGYAGGPVTNCFWNQEINRMGIDGDIGLDTAQMMEKVTFTAAGWDFDDASIDGDPADWRIRDGEDYPRLVWQPIIPGDIAGDPNVDVTDLLVVAEEWMQSCSGCSADVNGDGVVNMTDLSIIGCYWLTSAWSIPGD